MQCIVADEKQRSRGNSATVISGMITDGCKSQMFLIPYHPGYPGLRDVKRVCCCL